MQTAFTVIQGQSHGRTLKARLLFGTGSSHTYVRETIQFSLELPVVGKEVSAMACFGSSQRQTQTLQQVKFSVQLRDGTFQQLLASVIPRISCPIWKMPLDVTKHPSLERLPLAELLSLTTEQVEIDILVGCDQYYDLTLTDRASFPDGLVFLDSKLGFICTGRVDQSDADSTSADLVLMTMNYQADSDCTLKQFWELENIGILPTTEKEPDEQALDQFKASVKFEEVVM